jgi:hypothetical protein
MLGDGGVEHAERIEDMALRDTLNAIPRAGIGRLRRFVSSITRMVASSKGETKKVAACAS